MVGTDAHLASPITLIGESSAFKACLSLLAQVAHHDVPLLILGETGTGKELIAKHAHYCSHRRGAGFIALNCGALSEELFANEVFGHRRGAFTGADRDSEGLAALADGGTLFFDEVDALNAQAQVSLLRFLQDGSFRRIGGGREKKVNVRICAASNANLPELVANGDFRLDLWYRLNVIELALPPLRERDNDVLILARHFVRKFSEIYQHSGPRFDAGLANWLCSQSWPGNVRELENTLHRWFLTHGAQLAANESADQGESCSCGKSLGPFSEERQKVVDAFERRYLQAVMADTGGNISAAARLAGKERTAFKRLIRKHHISAEAFTAQQDQP